MATKITVTVPAGVEKWATRSKVLDYIKMPCPRCGAHAPVRSITFRDDEDGALVGFEVSTVEPHVRRGDETAVRKCICFGR